MVRFVKKSRQDTARELKRNNAVDFCSRQILLQLRSLALPVRSRIRGQCPHLCNELRRRTTRRKRRPAQSVLDRFIVLRSGSHRSEHPWLLASENGFRRL